MYRFFAFCEWTLARLVHFDLHCSEKLCPLILTGTPIDVDTLHLLNVLFGPAFQLHSCLSDLNCPEHGTLVPVAAGRQISIRCSAFALSELALQACFREEHLQRFNHRLWSWVHDLPIWSISMMIHLIAHSKPINNQLTAMHNQPTSFIIQPHLLSPNSYLLPANPHLVSPILDLLSAHRFLSRQRTSSRRWRSGRRPS